MNTSSLDELNPLEIDVLVAEHVMQWRRHEWKPLPNTDRSVCPHCRVMHPEHMKGPADGFCGHGLTVSRQSIPEFSNSPLAAKRVLNKMKKRAYSLSMFETPLISSVLNGTLVIFRKGVYPAERNDIDETDGVFIDERRNRAICMAALLAVGALELAT